MTTPDDTTHPTTTPSQLDEVAVLSPTGARAAAAPQWPTERLAAVARATLLAGGAIDDLAYNRDDTPEPTEEMVIEADAKIGPELVEGVWQGWMVVHQCRFLLGTVWLLRYPPTQRWACVYWRFRPNPTEPSREGYQTAYDFDTWWYLEGNERRRQVWENTGTAAVAESLVDLVDQACMTEEWTAIPDEQRVEVKAMTYARDGHDGAGLLYANAVIHVVSDAAAKKVLDAQASSDAEMVMTMYGLGSYSNLRELGQNHASDILTAQWTGTLDRYVQDVAHGFETEAIHEAYEREGHLRWTEHYEKEQAAKAAIEAGDPTAKIPPPLPDYIGRCSICAFVLSPEPEHLFLLDHLTELPVPDVWDNDTEQMTETGMKVVREAAGRLLNYWSPSLTPAGDYPYVAPMLMHRVAAIALADSDAADRQEEMTQRHDKVVETDDGGDEDPHVLAGLDEELHEAFTVWEANKALDLVAMPGPLDEPAAWGSVGVHNRGFWDTLEAVMPRWHVTADITVDPQDLKGFSPASGSPVTGPVRLVMWRPRDVSSRVNNDGEPVYAYAVIEEQDDPMSDWGMGGLVNRINMLLQFLDLYFRAPDPADDFDEQTYPIYDAFDDEGDVIANHLVDTIASHLEL